MGQELKSKVYIKINESNKVVAIDGGYSISNVDTTNWIFIDEGVGDKYNLCQTHYLDKPLLTPSGAHNYIYENNCVREATPEEIEDDTPEIKPTLIEEIEAQLFYTATMTDTLL